MAEVTGCDSGRIFPRSLGSACATESHRLLSAEVEVNPRLHPALLLIGMKLVAGRAINTNGVNLTHWSYYAAVIRTGGLNSKHSGQGPAGRAQAWEPAGGRAAYPSGKGPQRSCVSSDSRAKLGSACLGAQPRARPRRARALGSHTTLGRRGTGRLLRKSIFSTVSTGLGENLVCQLI